MKSVSVGIVFPLYLHLMRVPNWAPLKYTIRSVDETVEENPR